MMRVELICQPPSPTPYTLPPKPYSLLPSPSSHRSNINKFCDKYDLSLFLYNNGIKLIQISINNGNNIYFHIDSRYWKSSTSYNIGDVIYSRNLPVYYRLECIVSGLAETTYTNIVQGSIITDNTVTWIVDDLRDCTPVGLIRHSLYVPNGYVKCKGATVNRNDYPRLVNLTTTYNLWTDDILNNPGLFGNGNGSTTMILPNFTGRLLQFDTTAGGKIDSGLPNITGNTRTQGLCAMAYNYGNGALFSGTKEGKTAVATSNEYGSATIHFDASKSNPIYGSSQIVQPQVIKVFAIMKY